MNLRKSLNGRNANSSDNLKRGLIDVGVVLGLFWLNKNVTVPSEVNAGISLVFVPEFFRQLRLYLKKIGVLDYYEDEHRRNSVLRDDHRLSMIGRQDRLLEAGEITAAERNNRIREWDKRHGYKR